MEYNEDKTIEYYDNLAVNYERNTYAVKESEYSPNLCRLEIVKGIVSSIPHGRILDAGCGSGKFLSYLAESDIDCAGCDISPNMIEQTRTSLANISKKSVPLFVTPLSDLSVFEDNSFDHVFSLGVFSYIPEEIEQQCYQEIHRVIKPGGYLVTTHQNEMFDIFTFNKYTLRFFKNNVYPLLDEVSGDNKLDVDDLNQALSSLITNPEQPIQVDSTKSGRDIIFIKPENPLAFGEKIQRHGFESKEFLYYHFHAMPPLLRNNNATLMKLSHEMEIHFMRKWQGLFMASSFINIATCI